MKKALVYISLADVLFVLMLAISGFFAFPLNKIVYYSAYILPFACVFFLAKKDKDIDTSPLGLGVSKDTVTLTLPLAVPTLLSVFFISFLTSLLLSLIKTQAVPDVSGNVITVILIHALLPAILEEWAFRYVPLTLLQGYSKRVAVIISAVFFASIHCNLWQLPYALLAGLVFCVLDISFNSIWPSVFLHFINNVFSIIWMRNSHIDAFVVVCIIVMALLFAVSVVPVFIYRKKYKTALLCAFENKSNEELSFLPYLVPIMCVLLALLSF